MESVHDFLRWKKPWLNQRRELVEETLLNIPEWQVELYFYVHMEE
jgi:hypothetical protein